MFFLRIYRGLICFSVNLFLNLKNCVSTLSTFWYEYHGGFTLSENHFLDAKEIPSGNSGNSGITVHHLSLKKQRKSYHLKKLFYIFNKLAMFNFSPWKPEVCTLSDFTYFCVYFILVKDQNPFCHNWNYFGYRTYFRLLSVNVSEDSNSMAN